MVAGRRRSRLARKTQLELLRFFVAGSSARTAAELVGVNRHTATLYFHKLRELIAQRMEAEAGELVSGEIELDESYFGPHRKGKRGRGASGKIPVFGILKRGGRVYTVMVPNVLSKTLMPIFKSRVQPNSIVYTDTFKAYNPIDVNSFHHMRIDKSESYARGNRHVNGIENFWSQAKRWLKRYNGIPKAHFHLFLKECEWRFNHRPTTNLLKTLKTWTDL